jgi:predicted XRE-type DNA-binding protein
MPKSIESLMASLPDDRQSAIEKRYRSMVQEVEGLAALRALTGKAQAEIAEALSIKQPSVSRMERQTDMYLSTLGAYIRAAGGDLQIRVTLPDGRAIELKNLGLSGQ